MPTWCCSTRLRDAPSPRATCTTRRDYTPYEGFSLTGAVRSVFVRGRPVIRDGAFVGTRGAGTFVGRTTAGGGG